MNGSLDQLQRQATSTNGQDVQLRALEREAKAQRDLLESYLAKYREATTRENIDAAPADGRIISRAIVSNTPAFPKKLPIVLIATLATFMLSAGYIATGELLRMTAPRVMGERAVASAPMRELKSQSPDVTGEIEQVASSLRASGDKSRKITVIGAHQNENVTLTALTLARLLARGSKVALVDLSTASSMLNAISSDPTAPGLTDLMRGQHPSARSSPRIGCRAFIWSARAVMRTALFAAAATREPRHRCVAARLRSCGARCWYRFDLPATLIASQAHAVIIPDPAITAEGRI